MDDLELDFLRYDNLQPEYVIELSNGHTYRAVLATAPTALAPAYDLFLPSGANIGKHVLPSGLDDVEIYFLGHFTWLDARTHNTSPLTHR